MSTGDEGGEELIRTSNMNGKWESSKENPRTSRRVSVIQAAGIGDEIEMSRYIYIVTITHNAHHSVWIASRVHQVLHMHTQCIILEVPHKLVMERTAYNGHEGVFGRSN